MDVQFITDQQQWNSFLLCQPWGHLLQSYEWGELLQYRGERIYRLGALEHGRLVGVMLLSVAPIPAPRQVRRLLPVWLYCRRGPTVEVPHSPALPALVQRAAEIAREEHAVILRLEPNVADDDPQMDAWLAAYKRLGFITNPHALYPRRSWVLDLRPAMEQLVANFRKTWRNDIRIAERQGVIVREAETEADFENYYRLLQFTGEREGFFVHSKDYHREMLRLFAKKGDAALLIAELHGEPLAAKLLIRFGNWCWDMFGATSDAYPRLPKTHLLQYRSLQWAKEHGCTHFDFRAIPEILEPDEEMWGVYHFKKGFGGFSRLNIPTQDYVYRPHVYTLWRRAVEARRALHRGSLTRKRPGTHPTPPRHPGALPERHAPSPAHPL